MTLIDRRGVMKGAVAGAMLLGAPASLMATPPVPRFFIYDGRFTRAIADARIWTERGVQLIDGRDIDLGQAWRTVLTAGRLQGGTVTGLTLWMDSYICETFGRDHGLAMVRRDTQADSGLQHWILQ